MRIYRYTGDDESETFTQEQVNSFMKKDKEKTSAEITQLRTDLQKITDQNATLSESATLSEEQALQFKTENDEMRSRGLSDSEKFAQERAGMENKIKDLETSGKNEADEWKNKHHSNLISQALQFASTPNEAHSGVTNPEHIVAQLASRTQVQEDGSIVVKDFQVKNEEGKFEIKDVSPIEAVTIMSQQDLHKNLFNPIGTGGTGDNNQGSKGTAPKISAADGPKDPTNMKDMQKWIKENAR